VGLDVAVTVRAGDIVLGEWKEAPEATTRRPSGVASATAAPARARAPPSISRFEIDFWSISGKNVVREGPAFIGWTHGMGAVRLSARTAIRVLLRVDRRIWERCVARINRRVSDPWEGPVDESEDAANFLSRLSH
jgi:hypothetical protein